MHQLFFIGVATLKLFIMIHEWLFHLNRLHPSNVRRLDMTLPHCSYQYMLCKISIFYIKFCRYTWEKNGKPYDWQVYDDRISQQPGRGTLVITSPRDEDIGKFSQISIVSNFCHNYELSSTMS